MAFGAQKLIRSNHLASMIGKKPQTERKNLLKYPDLQGGAVTGALLMTKWASRQPEKDEKNLSITSGESYSFGIQYGITVVGKGIILA